MKEQEVIIVNIPKDIYREIVINAIKYALISFPFTINRMQINNINKRIYNISKGKIAEGIFEYFCTENSINTDFELCQTPFYKPDNRDFIFDNSEWDIKNNFIYHNTERFSENKYTDLPALIPSRNSHDQWGKRNIKKFDFTKSVNYVFTFMKISDKSKYSSFFDINLSNKQIEFIEKLSSKYRNSKQNSKPFEDDWFWENMRCLKNGEPSFNLRETPSLVITGYANYKYWDLFKITNKNENNSYIDYNKKEWYKKLNNEKLSFLDGTIITRIPNATVPVSMLPSFSSLFPYFEKRINYGKFI
ncbi:MAG: hypothetical protein U9R54_07275 [Bacteroidota bacterium]|nr:hypothetical protein [Bacteroidota bacterium]